jgi:hypothetical protein
VTADVDGNGSVDVVSGASGGTEIAWWRLADFVATGSLESRVLAVAEDLAMVRCSVDAELPPGTGVSIQVRAGSQPSALGEWVAAAPGTAVTTWARGPAFLQYRLVLETSDPSVSPVVHGVSVEWESEVAPRSSAGARRVP